MRIKFNKYLDSEVLSANKCCVSDDKLSEFVANERLASQPVEILSENGRYLGKQWGKRFKTIALGKFVRRNASQVRWSEKTQQRWLVVLGWLGEDGCSLQVGWNLLIVNSMEKMGCYSMYALQWHSPIMMNSKRS